MWSGRDPSDELKARLTPLADGVDAEELIERVYSQLADAPSAVVAISLEDGIGVAERPNHPGTVIPENWSRPLPLSVEQITTSPRAADLAAAVRSRRP